MVPIKNSCVEEYCKKVKEFIDKYSRKIKTCDIENELKKIDSSVDLKKLLSLDFSQLRLIANRYNINNNINPSFFNDFAKLYEKIFIIDNESKEDKKILQSEIIKLKTKDISVCPYCNINYIFTFNKFSTFHRMAQFDHYYPKSKYPILAISYYNLIPCCNDCNHTKGESDPLNDFKVLNPYDIILSNNSYLFKAEETARLGHFKINLITDENNSKITEGLSSLNHTLNIVEKYQYFNFIVDELYDKSQMITDPFVKSILDMFKGISDIANKSSLEYRKMFLVNYIEDSDFLKRSLSKLTKDIATQFGII